MHRRHWLEGIVSKLEKETREPQYAGEINNSLEFETKAKVFVLLSRETISKSSQALDPKYHWAETFM